MSLDRFGTWAGLLCAVHCGALAIAPALVALAGVGALWSSSAEWIAVGLSSTFALLGAVFGFRRHRRGWVALLFVLAVVWMLGTRWLEQSGSHGPWFAGLCALGGVVAALAHVVNRRCSDEPAGHGAHEHVRS